MIRQTPIRAQSTLPALICLAALIIGTLIPVADSAGYLTLFIGGFIAAAIVGVLFSIPTRLLPGLTLLVTLLVPTDVTLLPNVLQGTAIGVVPLAVWMIRTPKSTQTPPALYILASLFGVWLALSEAFAPLHTHRGWEWLVTVGIAVIFSIISAPTGLKSRDFRALFLNVASVLGLYALLEGFLLHRNVLFGALFEHTIWWANQQHEVSYRVTTLLGHPLINGLVFSAASVLAASDLMQKPQRPRVALARLVVLIGATAATHSRGAAIALAVGVVVVLVFTHGRGREQATRRLILVVCSLLGAALLIYSLAARDESSQGQASAQVRVTVIKHTSETLRGLEPFGAGPGESEDYRKVKQLPGSEIALENSYAELAVSLGPPGALLMVALLATVVIFGVQNELVVGEAAALLTILVDIGGFNAVEGHRPVLILIALLAISVITAPRSLMPSAIQNLRADQPVPQPRLALAAPGL